MDSVPELRESEGCAATGLGHSRPRLPVLWVHCECEAKVKTQLEVVF